MSNWIGRTIVRAIIYAIVFKISVSISNSIRNSISSSIEKKMLSIGIDPNNPDSRTIELLLDIDVQKAIGGYRVTFQENIFGVFSTKYIARDKNDAVERLGKKAFGFAFAHKDSLTKEQLLFLLNIYYNTTNFEKNKRWSKVENIRNKIYNYNFKISGLKHDEDYQKRVLDKLKHKLNKTSSHKKTLKFNIKIDIINKKISNINNDLIYYKQELKKLNENLVIEEEEYKNPNLMDLINVKPFK